MSTEWNNGDALFYPDSKMVIFIGMNGEWPVVRTWNQDLERFEFYIECEYQLSSKMPESPEEKEERERLEAAIELHDLFNMTYYDGDMSGVSNAEWDCAPEQLKKCYFAMVDKTNHRKTE